MDSRIKQKTAIQCDTEYDQLQHVLVVPPAFMAITDVINETQSHYVGENINRSVALEQHGQFVETLIQEGVDVDVLEPNENLNEQVFTRDIGFVIGDDVFVSQMDTDVRKDETDILKSWLEKHHIPYRSHGQASIEGGDVVVDGKKVWVGNSGRTEPEAIDELRQALPQHTIVEIRLRPDILHLDCVFNIIDEDEALIYPEAVHKEDLEKVKNHYDLLPVTGEEQFRMGPNVLALGNRKIISLPENERLNDKLGNAGYEVIEVPFSEIIKSGGSYRCCTLPLHRKPEE